MPTKTFSDSSGEPEYAGFGVRLLAYGVDYFIMFALGMVLSSAMGTNPIYVLSQVQTLDAYIQMTQSPAYQLSSLISLLIGAAYFIFFWMNNDGATPGKKLKAIKVIKKGEKQISLGTAIARYVGFILSAFILFIGYFMIIFDKEKQGLHDKIAGTYVVKTGEKPQTALAVILTLMAVFTMIGYMSYIMVRTFQLMSIGL